MQFVNNPTEQSTAVTDLLLAFVAVILVIITRKKGATIDSKKTLIWSAIFGPLAIAAFTGALAHGLVLSEYHIALLWYVINFCLGISVSLFAAAVFYDINGYSVSALIIATFLICGTLFFIISVIKPGSFLIFIIYETAAMLFALIGYLFLAVWRKLSYAWLMSGGILISIIASVVQAAGTAHLKFIWEFDHNGIFHILQLFGLLLIESGLIKDFNSRMRLN